MTKKNPQKTMMLMIIMMLIMRWCWKGVNDDLNDENDYEDDVKNHYDDDVDDEDTTDKVDDNYLWGDADDGVQPGWSDDVQRGRPSVAKGWPSGQAHLPNTQVSVRDPPVQFTGYFNHRRCYPKQNHRLLYSVSMLCKSSLWKINIST